MSTEQGSSKLLVGMLQQADIASNLLYVIKAQADIDNCEAKATAIKNLITSLPTNLNLLSNKFSYHGSRIATQAISEIQSAFPVIVDYTKQSLYWGILGWQCAANMQTMLTKNFAQERLLDTNLAIVYDIPESIVKEQAREYWLSVYRPALPTEALTIQQYIREKITATKAAEYLAQHGVPDDAAMMLYDSYENYPSVREMVLASEYSPITDAEIQAGFKFSNITLQANKDFYIKYAHSIQLRNELNQNLSLLRADYVDGILSKANLTAEVAMHKPNLNEQNQILANCDRAYASQLLRMEIQAEVYLYRTEVYKALAEAEEPPDTAENYLYLHLVAQGIDEAMANATTRLEAAKKAVNWERYS